MSKFGEDVLVVAIERLSPHLERASSQLAYFLFNKKREMEPEEKLAIYVKLAALRKKLEYNSTDNLTDKTEGEFDEGTAFSGDADFDSGDYGDSWDCSRAINELSKGNEWKYKEPDEQDK